MLSKFNIRYSDMVMKKGDQDLNKSKEFTKRGDIHFSQVSPYLKLGQCASACKLREWTSRDKLWQVIMKCLCC